MKKIAMIMAGGGGTRFWPLSTKEKPKHLQRIVSDDTMLNETINRLKKVVPIEDIYIMTNKAYVKGIKESIDQSFLSDHIIAEPESRNTAPCIIYFTELIRKKYGEALLMISPCDHYIKEEEKFINSVNSAFLKAEEGFIVTIGLTPDYPATGYGYIKCVDDKVLQFTEKPSLERAKKYVNEKNYYFNSGMFFFSSDTLKKAAKKHCKDIYDKMIESDINIGFANCRNASFDYEIMEKAEAIYMVKGEFIWSDVGTFNSVYELMDKDENGNYCSGDLLTIDSSGSYIKTSKKKVALIGIDDVIVIETGNELLICKRDRDQEVKKIVSLLESK